jgi:peptidase C39-like protein
MELLKTSRILIGCVVATALAGAGWYLLHTRAAAEMPPIAASGGSEALEVQIEPIPYWLQNDLQWGAETIGGSYERMATAGCTVTCVAMALSSLGFQTSPLQLCRDLKAQDGFTAQGYLIWGTVESVTNHETRIEFPALTHGAIDAALLENRPVIAKIMLGGTVPHWVLIVGKDGPEYLVMDPLNAKRTLLRLSDRSSKIYAVRVLRQA